MKMDWLKKKTRRYLQVLRYGIIDSKEISTKTGLNRIGVFLDIVRCFVKYYVFSDQYKAKEIWKLREEEREQLARVIGGENKYRDKWDVDRWENLKFFFKLQMKMYIREK